HPKTTVVKRLTPAVVLRIWAILGNSRSFMGTVLYMCTHRRLRTTTNCIFWLSYALYQRTVIVCRHLCRLFRVLAAFPRAARIATIGGDLLHRRSEFFHFRGAHETARFLPFPSGVVRRDATFSCRPGELI